MTISWYIPTLLPENPYLSRPKTQEPRNYALDVSKTLKLFIQILILFMIQKKTLGVHSLRLNQKLAEIQWYGFCRMQSEIGFDAI